MENDSTPDDDARNEAEAGSAAPPTAEALSRRGRPLRIAAALCAALLVLTGSMVAVRLRKSYCAEVTPRIVAVPRAVQRSLTDPYGSRYSTNIAVNLDGTVYAFPMEYDDPNAAIAALAANNKAVERVREENGLEPLSARNISAYYAYARRADSNSAPDWWNDELADFDTVRTIYGNTRINDGKLAYMQCRTADSLLHDPKFRN